MPRPAPAPLAAARTRVPGSRTRDRVLDAAERLAAVRGFHGFSYADVAARVGLTTASLHYHFPGKEELGRALVERYGEGFRAALAEIDGRAPGPRARLEAYAGLYEATLARGRMCLCGMFAAEVATLPASVRRALRAFFEANEAWLERTLEEGRASAALAFEGPARDAARHWISTLEGALLLARSFADPARFRAARRGLFAAYAALAKGR